MRGKSKEECPSSEDSEPDCSSLCCQKSQNTPERQTRLRPDFSCINSTSILKVSAFLIIYFMPTDARADAHPPGLP